MEMLKFDSYDALESSLASKGMVDVLWNITELCRGELWERPKTNKKVQNTIIDWWNKSREYHPSLLQHRLSFFLLWHLRKEIEKAK